MALDSCFVVCVFTVTVSQVASTINFEKQKTVQLSPGSSPRTSLDLLTRKISTLGNARLKNAKLIAENAIRVSQTVNLSEF